MKIWDITNGAAENATAYDVDGPAAILREADGAVAVSPYLPSVGGGGIIATLVPVGQRRAILICAPRAVLYLNGYPPASVAALQDRDEIRVRGNRLVFAAFADAAVGPFDVAQRGSSDCAACSTPIADGEPVRACPACGVLYHAGRDGDPEPVAPACDVEDDRCSSCRRLRSELVWTPADLARREAALDDFDDCREICDDFAEAETDRNVDDAPAETRDA